MELFSLMLEGTFSNFKFRDSIRGPSLEQVQACLGAPEIPGTYLRLTLRVLDNNNPWEFLEKLEWEHSYTVQVSGDYIYFNYWFRKDAVLPKGLSKGCDFTIQVYGEETNFIRPLKQTAGIIKKSSKFKVGRTVLGLPFLPVSMELTEKDWKEIDKELDKINA